MIRDGDPQLDASACAAIYAPYVENGATSFEERPPNAAEMESRIKRYSQTHPWLIAEEAAGVVGYAYACHHRERAAYRWAADVSVYVAATEHRRGHGRRLYEELFKRLRRQRFQVAIAGITLPNPASVGLHEQLGFAEVAIYRRIGWKLDAWHDVGSYQLELAPAGKDQPPEPLPPGSQLVPSYPLGDLPPGHAQPQCPGPDSNRRPVA